MNTPKVDRWCCLFGVVTQSKRHSVFFIAITSCSKTKWKYSVVWSRSPYHLNGLNAFIFISISCRSSFHRIVCWFRVILMIWLLHFHILLAWHIAKDDARGIAQKASSNKWAQQQRQRNKEIKKVKINHCILQIIVATDLYLCRSSFIHVEKFSSEIWNAKILLCVTIFTVLIQKG